MFNILDVSGTGPRSIHYLLPLYCQIFIVYIIVRIYKAMITKLYATVGLAVPTEVNIQNVRHSFPTAKVKKVKSFLCLTK
jgi:hypothetical protein